MSADPRRAVPGFSAVPRLRAGTAIEDFVRAWLTSEALAALVEEFGGTAPDASLPVRQLLRELSDFAEQAWSYRQGRERNQLAEPSFSNYQRALVDASAKALGMQDTSAPERTRFDQMLILGGLARGCLARPLHAARMLSETGLKIGRVTALASLRPLNGGENALLDGLGHSGLETEFDVADLGLRTAFSIEQIEHEERGSTPGGGDWIERSYRATGPGGLELSINVVAVPETAPGVRATTVDGYRWVTSSRRQVADGDSLLIVTTAIYRIYQLTVAIGEMGAAETRPRSIDAAGMNPGDVDRRLDWMPTTASYLEEVRGTLRGLNQLCERFADAAPPRQ